MFLSSGVRLFQRLEPLNIMGLLLQCLILDDLWYEFYIEFLSIQMEGRKPGGGGGGGHCLFEGRYRLPNYRPCFLALSDPQFSLTAPYF